MMLFSLRENENDEVESGDGDVASSAADERTDPGEEVGMSFGLVPYGTLPPAHRYLRRHVHSERRMQDDDRAYDRYRSCPYEYTVQSET
ncbi:hypothetical protein Y032_0029g1843 [Ancylostoma ceylanicum]|uniref:Uncharacterized protein n=1 Tax=Ancylostoma ceylanicum TaxID=53326 RepID=A0A016USE4_9BILA|nr:hypothetical protein Y032_0029g1843 [Ancylostoma ceylanicum]